MGMPKTAREFTRRTKSLCGSHLNRKTARHAWKHKMKKNIWKQTWKCAVTFLLLFLISYITYKPSIYTELCDKGELLSKITGLKRTRIFVIPPSRQYSKVNIHSVRALTSPRFKRVLHGYMSISSTGSEGSYNGYNYLQGYCLESCPGSDYNLNAKETN